MSSLVFGMASNGSVKIDDMSMISTSFPNFKDIFGKIGAKIKPNNNLKPIIAIDGTAGSGKGTYKIIKNIKF